MIGGGLNFSIIVILACVGFVVLIASLNESNKKGIKIGLAILLMFFVLFLHFWISDTIKKKKIEKVSDIISVNADKIYKNGFFVYSTEDTYTIFIQHKNGANEKRKFSYEKFLIYEDNSKKPELFKECFYNIYKGLLYDIKGAGTKCNYAVIVPTGTIKRSFKVE